MTDNTALLESLRAKRRAKELSLEQLSELVGRSPVYVASALHGQQRLSPEVASRLAEVLELDAATLDPLLECPVRNSDPLKYRLHEMVEVYGDAIRDLTNEAFGDGILSAIDLKLSFERRGERAIITLDSKFLPYKEF